MKNGYGLLAGLAVGFVLAMAIVEAASLSQAVQQPVGQTTITSAGSQPLFAANRSVAATVTRPTTATGTRPSAAGLSNIQSMAKENVSSVLAVITPFLVAIALGVGVHRLSTRRAERE